MKTVSIKIFISIALFFIVNFTNAATLTSSVNRNEIKKDQTITLTVQYDGQANTNSLDLSALKKDFNILAVVPNTNYYSSTINGTTTKQTNTSWSVTLAAEKEGSLTIPAFKINDDVSKAITIQVNALTAEAAELPKAIETSLTINNADNRDIKPGEQILLTTVLSVAQNVNDLRGEEFTINDADLELIDQQEGQRIENGIARRVIIWQYAAFPKSSGKLTLPKQTFTGNIGGRRGIFQRYPSGGERVIGSTMEQSIEVSPKPETNGKTWFPANNVIIQSSWAGDSSNIRVGEPITRNIIITATGQRASAIPPLTVQDNNEQYKLYEDQPQLENTVSESGITGRRLESLAIVPSKSGSLTLPEQRISWWNNNTDTWQEATLPAETLTVLPSINDNNIPQTSPDNINADNQNLSSNQNQSSFQSSNNDSNKTINLFWKLAPFTLAIICGLQFFLLNRQRTRPQAKKATNKKSPANEQALWSELQKNITKSDAQQIRRQLLKWAQTSLPENNIKNLNSLTQIANDSEQVDEIKTQINSLERYIYSNGEEINTEKFTHAISKLRDCVIESKNTSEQPEELAKLYPL